MSTGPVKKDNKGPAIKKVELKPNKSQHKYDNTSHKTHKVIKMIEPVSRIQKLFRRLTKDNP